MTTSFETGIIDIREIPLERKEAEKVFNVRLKDRDYTIRHYLKDDYVEIVYGDKFNVFQWLERLSKKEFDKRIDKARNEKKAV